MRKTTLMPLVLAGMLGATPVAAFRSGISTAISTRRMRAIRLAVDSSSTASRCKHFRG
jgi:hypothetical protein